MSSAIIQIEMTNLQKIFKRVAVLENRREILITLNQKHHYTSSQSNKSEQYFRVLNEIQDQKYTLLIQKNKLWRHTVEHQTLMATKGLSGRQILILNA